MPNRNHPPDVHPTVDIEIKPSPSFSSGTVVAFTAKLDWSGHPDPDKVRHVQPKHYKWRVRDSWGADAGVLDPQFERNSTARWRSDGVPAGSYVVEVTVEGLFEEEDLERKWHAHREKEFDVRKASYGPPDEMPVRLRRSGVARTEDIVLWTLIRKGAEAISFDNYSKFISSIICGDGESVHDKRVRSLALPFPGVEGYSLLKTATEVFLMTHCGVTLDKLKLSEWLQDTSIRLDDTITPDQAELLVHRYLREINLPEDPKHFTIPYLDLIRQRLPEVGIRPAIGSALQGANCFGILIEKLTRPCLIELIWSYWLEEGMLVQAMNAISLRFQNRKTSEPNEVMSRLDIDPLRPMGNLLWGYIQDEQHRLSVLRRAYEYDHQYGITLIGRALHQFRPADTRSRFLEAFHNLLHLTAVFYTQDDDTTVIADGFPLLNTLREVHLILAEGAHNQFGDLPSTARQEMLMQQWLLARPEMREFLGGRIMVPYPEPWMDRVDTVKRMFSWTDTTVTHFHELAIYGERLLLSIRYGNWSDINASAAQAANWARFWRAEVQGYLHGYRAATGVDLAPSEALYLNAAQGRGIQPSALLRKRLTMQNQPR